MDQCRLTEVLKSPQSIPQVRVTRSTRGSYPPTFAKHQWLSAYESGMPAALCLPLDSEAQQDNQPGPSYRHFFAQTPRIQVIRMPKLFPSRLLLDTATREGKAIAALNFYNAETLLAHARAANGLNASIILQTTESTINYLGLRMIVAMANAAADEIEQPVALHLDHGGSYELAARCVDAGY